MIGTDDEPKNYEFDVPLARGGSGLGVRLCSYPRPPALVIKVGGEVDACNAEDVSDYIQGFARVEHPLVLDLSSVEFLGASGFRAIMRFAGHSRRTDCVVVTSDAVDLMLRVTGSRGISVAQSIDEAVRRCASMPKVKRDPRSLTIAD